jgi:outer membrane protein OmpA-like peptidoglycan-associated protein
LIKYDVLKKLHVKEAPLALLASKQIELNSANKSLSLKETSIAAKSIENKSSSYQSYTLYYQLNRSKILPDQIAKLESWINKLDKNYISKIEIDAHTDDSGSYQYNQKLSDKRAESLKTDIKKLIPNLTTVEAQGKGELEPKIICGTSKPCSFKERNKNRRAEIKVYFNP